MLFSMARPTRCSSFSPFLFWLQQVLSDEGHQRRRCQAEDEILGFKLPGQDEPKSKENR